MNDAVIIALASAGGGVAGGLFTWLTMRANRAPALAESANEAVETIGAAYAATLEALKGQITMLTHRITVMDEHIEDLEAHITVLTGALVKAGHPVPERAPRRRKAACAPVSE